MKKFELKTKDGEIIATIKAFDINEANELFSLRKQITIDELLSIFKVEELVYGLYYNSDYKFQNQFMRHVFALTPCQCKTGWDRTNSVMSL